MWFTTSKMFFVTCPNCRKLVSLKDQAVVEATKDDLDTSIKIDSEQTLHKG